MMTREPLFRNGPEYTPGQLLLIEYFDGLPKVIQNTVSRIVSCDARLLGYSTDFTHPDLGSSNWISILNHKNTFSGDVIQRLASMRGVTLPDGWFSQNEKRFHDTQMGEIFRGVEPDISSRPLEKVTINTSDGWNRFIVQSDQPDRIAILTHTLTATNSDFTISSVGGRVTVSSEAKKKLDQILGEFGIDLLSPISIQ